MFWCKEHLKLHLIAINIVAQAEQGSDVVHMTSDKRVHNA